MSDYGKETNLVDILQDLVTHCKSQCGNDVEIVLSLPDTVSDLFELRHTPKERVVNADGEAIKPPLVLRKISQLYLVGGTVKFV